MSKMCITNVNAIERLKTKTKKNRQTKEIAYFSVHFRQLLQHQTSEVKLSHLHPTGKKDGLIGWKTFGLNPIESDFEIRSNRQPVGV